MKKKLKDLLINWKPLAYIIRISRSIILPGFEKVPLFDVAVFFFKGLQRGTLTTRASSVSFTFFLAIFPSVIFFFTLIPYIPFNEFKETLLLLINDFFPKNTYEAVTTTIEDIILRKRGDLLSFGFILSLYLSTNGIRAIIVAFNQTYYTIETRSAIKIRIIAFFLVLIISLIVIIGITLIIGGNFALDFIEEKNILRSQWTIYMLIIGRWLVTYVMVFLVISLLYYYAPAEKKHFRFFSPGSSFATFLSILTTVGFN
ncbi:YihY/virulence factor BrkB family protein, partial [candidate division KSB1 bacterium]